MFLRTGGCACLNLLVRISAALALIIAAMPYSFGQELKAASTLGFSVRVLGQSDAQVAAPHFADLVADGASRRITIPIGMGSTLDGRVASPIHVVARFRGGNVTDANELSARIDNGELQKLKPENRSMDSALTLPNGRPTSDEHSRRARVLEFNWKMMDAESAANVFEIEIRQY